MKTAYFMEGSVQRLDLNAALVPQRGYAAIPGMGNVGVEANSNFLSVRNFLYPAPDGDGLVTFLHGSVGNREFLRRMRRNNHLEINVRENLLGFGGYARRYFWSFGLNLRSESSINLPKDLFSLLKRLEPGQYDLKGTDINSDNYLEMAMGFAFPIRILTKEVTIGFRAKGLLGLAHASVHIDGMDIDLNDREWRADLRGSVNANVAGMNFSDLRGRIELQDVMDRLDPSDIDLNRIGSWGLAFDLGAETRSPPRPTSGPRPGSRRRSATRSSRIAWVSSASRSTCTPRGSTSSSAWTTSDSATASTATSPRFRSA